MANFNPLPRPRRGSPARYRAAAFALPSLLSTATSTAPEGSFASMYPDARSVGQWLRHGWFVAVPYGVGFFVMLALIGFHPGSTPRGSTEPAIQGAPASSINK
jgi:hypothetical protein